MEMVKEFEHMIYIPLKVERSNHQVIPIFYVATSLLEECEDDTHTPEMGTWESFGTPEI